MTMAMQENDFISNGFYGQDTVEGLRPDKEPDFTQLLIMSDQKTYPLSQRSPAGNPGFELFKAKDDGLYYFHFNNDKGEAILFSQGYPTAKKRTATLNALRKRMLLKSSYVRKSQNGSCYFIVVNNPKEEIARSKTFETEKSRDLVIEKLQQGSIPEGATKKVELSPKKPGEPNPAEENRSKASPKGASAPPARYRFNITFRKVADKAPLIGEIEFPISEGKSTFQGFDIDAIQQFITQHLPYETTAFPKERQKEIDAIKTELNQAVKAEREKAAKQEAAFRRELEAANRRETELRKEFEANASALKQQFQIRTNELKASLKKAQGRIKEMEKEIQVPPTTKEDVFSADTIADNQQTEQFRQLLAKEQARLKKPIALMVGGQMVDNLNMPKSNLPVELLMNIDQPEEQKAFEYYRAIFQIKSMESGRIQQAVKFSGKLDQQNQILVSANSLNACDPGLYRVIIRVFPSNPLVPDCEIEGKRVVFVF